MMMSSKTNNRAIPQSKSSTKSVLIPGRSINWTGLLNLLVIYIVWSSTYLAIRVAVHQGTGFPPFTLGALRVTIAGIVLLISGALAGKRIKPTREEILTLGCSGLLLWVGGNGMVNWAEQRADSGLAALMIAASPIWIALLDAILDREIPSWKFVLALLVGFAGIAVLSFPTIMTSNPADLFSILALLLAGLSWSIGMVLQSRRRVDLSVQVSSGYQQLIGGFGFIMLVLLFGEPRPSPTPQAWIAFGYLVVFGSLLAFTAMVQALRLLPAKIVITYTYVNPVLAVFLGWIILGEIITIWTIVGAFLVLLGVTGMFRERYAENGKS
jgi:drug/metabolite transporter (DMT)-like permease